MDALTFSPTEQRNLDTLVAVVACWNSHDVAGILAHYDDEITWHDRAAGRTYRGKGEVGTFLRSLFSALPDLRLELSTRLADRDYIAEEYTIIGTHQGPLFGIPATGRALQIRVASFQLMRDGRLAEDSFYVDVAGVLAQMGLFPPLSFIETRGGRAALGGAVLLRYPGRTVRRQGSLLRGLVRARFGRRRGGRG
jgi:steroid delta-isomerase-like uncharacterized protein